MFITTKIWKDDFNDVQGALKESLRKLQLDYIDLYLVHWMVTDVDWETLEIKGPTMLGVWKQMEDLYEEGLSKNIGVSNCPVMMYLDLLAGAKVKPQVNQIEANPHFQQTQLVEFIRKFGTQITAYAPMGAIKFTGSDSLFNDDVIKSIAKKHEISIAQVCLAWNIQRNVVVIPKSTNKERMQDNIDSLSVTLDEDDLEKISKIDKKVRYFDPAKFNEEDGDEFGWNKSPIWA